MGGSLGGLIAAFPTPVTGSFESIATVTATGSQSSLTFSSIPQTYKSLQVRFISRSTLSDNGTAGKLNFNSGATWSDHRLLGDGNNAYSAADVSQSEYLTAFWQAAANDNTGLFGAGIIDIIDYANTTKNKTVRTMSGFNNNGGTTRSRMYLTSGLWQSTSAVNSITFYCLNNENFAAGTTFALYGIKG